jgi:hypothetical protein
MKLTIMLIIKSGLCKLYDVRLVDPVPLPMMTRYPYNRKEREKWKIYEEREIEWIWDLSNVPASESLPKISQMVDK